MPIKVKTKLTLKELPGKIKKNFSKDLKNQIGDEIEDHIKQGKSPVKGARFKQYASSTAKRKGRRRPVDMTGTGEMLDSLKVKQNKIGQVLVEFKSKVARYHQDGTNKMPQRKLLPKRGEIFATGIMKKIVKILDKAVKKSIKR